MIRSSVIIVLPLPGLMNGGVGISSPGWIFFQVKSASKRYTVRMTPESSTGGLVECTVQYSVRQTVSLAIKVGNDLG